MKKSKKERKAFARKCTPNVKNNADYDVGNNSFLSPIFRVDWPSERGSSEGSGSYSQANRMVSNGNVKLALPRRPGTLHYRYAAAKSDFDDTVVETKVENCSGVVERNNDGADLSAAVQSHSGNWNVQSEYQRKREIQAIQKIPFGTYEVLPGSAISQRNMLSQFNVQTTHSELFNKQRHGENMSQVPNLRPNTSMIRNGAVSAGYAAPFNRALIMSPCFSLSLLPPLSNRFGCRVLTSSMYSAGFFPSRVPFPSAAAPRSFSRRDISLQRMQSLTLQAQQHKPQVRIPPHDLHSNNSGFCNWVPIVTSRADHQQSLCQVCYDFKRRNIYPIPFHCCVQDRVTLGFRGPSPAGPIERPGKRRDQVAG